MKCTEADRQRDAQARALDAVVPTLVEPELSSGLPAQRWYNDMITGSASFQQAAESDVRSNGPRMTLADMQKLRELKRPQINRLLDLAYMPRLTDIGLVAHVAGRKLADDPKFGPEFLTLEQLGHQLAKSVRENPSEASRIAELVQRDRELLNAKAARAARGDAQALSELVQLADSIAASPLGQSALNATQKFVALQHSVRLVYMANDKTNDGFFLLRTHTFAGALRRAEDRDRAHASMAFQVPQIPPGGYCFAVPPSAGWDAAEIEVHQTSCTATGVAKPPVRSPDEQVCASLPAAEAMQALIKRAALFDPALKAMREISQGAGSGKFVDFKVVGARIDSTASATASAQFVCSALSNVLVAYRNSDTPVTSPGKVDAPFSFERLAGGTVRIRLIRLMGERLALPYEVIIRAP